MKIGFLSDLHVTNNVDSVGEALISIHNACIKNKVDKLFLAGDSFNNPGDTLDLVDELTNMGVDTYTIFGNHEYWSTGYKQAQKIVHDKYLHGKTLELKDDKVLIGLDGLFDYSFVLDIDNEYTRRLTDKKYVLNKIGKETFDLRFNKIKKYEDVFTDMEDKLVSQLEENRDKEIIFMLHYVPSHDFVIYKDDDIWNANNSFMGSQRYQELAEEYGVKRVIFGHTHYKFNKTINGIDYHCNPVGYKKNEFDGSFSERVEDRLLTFEL